MMTRPQALIPQESPFHSVQWHLTAKCQNQCKHCYMYDEDYTDSVANELSIDEVFKTFDEIYIGANKRGKAITLSLSGGDPLLYTGFFDFLEYTKDKIARLSILGNPNLLTKDVVNRLKKYNVSSYQISLEGPKTIHDILRSPGSFDLSIKGLNMLKAAGIPTHVMMTLSESNAMYLFELMEIVAKESVDLFAFARICKSGAGNDLSSGVFISPDDYKLLLYKYIEKAISLNRSGSKTVFGKKDHLFALLYADIGIIPANSEFRERGCGVGYTTSILPNGTVYACRRFRSPIGNIKRDNYWDIFEGPEIAKYSNWELFSKCSKCNLLQQCRGCPAVAFGLNKNFYSPDPQCWKVV